jgi:hypothetical protein
MTSSELGILGSGYLGAELLSLSGSQLETWATFQEEKSDLFKQRMGHSAVRFQWDQQETWQNLPDRNSTLVICIPPLSHTAGEEEVRLRRWCDWMVSYRKNINQCIYISSTGVYPNLPGLWSEVSTFDPDTPKGLLRRTTEQVLSEYFMTTSIRSGAIYGPHRNIGEKLIKHQPIPKGRQQVHRIHVHDLARIVLLIADLKEPPDLINAVDLESETTEKVADWLSRQAFFPGKADHSISYDEARETRKYLLSEPDRKIDNQRLVKKYRYKFVFPTYREGLKNAFHPS